MPNKFDPNVLLYTVGAVGFSIVPNVLWQTRWSDKYPDFVGLKFISYAQTYTWLPFAAVSLYHLLSATIEVKQVMNNALTLSFFTPYFLNFIAVYYALVWGGSDAYSLPAVFIYAGTVF